MAGKHYFYAVEYGISLLSGAKHAERVYRFNNKALRNVWIAENPTMRAASPSTSKNVRRAIKFSSNFPWPVRI